MDRGVAILEAEDKRLNKALFWKPDSVAHFKPESGQVIVGEIETYPEQNRPAVAKIIEVLGDYADSGMESKLLCANTICRTNSARRVPKPRKNPRPCSQKRFERSRRFARFAL